MGKLDKEVGSGKQDLTSHVKIQFLTSTFPLQVET